MYITSMLLEQFGTCANLAVDGCSPGVNVVFGPPGSGKATLLHFLRAIFGGFDRDARERFLMPPARGGGGSVTVATASGRQIISRFDDGGREGRLTVERADGAMIGHRDLRELLGDVPLSLLDLVYFVDFESGPDLSVLLSEAVRCGLPVLSVDLEQRRERAHLLQQELASGEMHLAALRRALATADHHLAELAQRKTELENQRIGYTTVPTDNAPDKLSAELRGLEAQRDRLKRTLRDTVARKQRAAEVADQMPGTTLPATISLSEPRRLLRSLELGIHDLQRSLDNVQAGSANACRCQSLPKLFGDRLQKMSQEVYEVCNALSHWQAWDEHRRAVEQRDQLSRCELELRHSLRSLSERRQQLLDAVSTDRLSHTLDPDHGHLCECDSHPLPAGTASFPAPTTRLTWERDLADVLRQIDYWTAERNQRILEIQRGESKLAETRARLGGLDEVHTSLATTASEHLRRMSAESWRRVHVAHDRAVFVEDHTGRRIPHSELDRGTRDQVYLAFCLAIIAAGRERGWQVPVVWNAALTHCPSRHARHTLEVLRDNAHRQQILCLTRHEHVVDVGSQLNLPQVVLPPRPMDLEPAPSRELASRYSPPPAELGPSPIVPAVDSEYHLFDHDPIEKTPSLDEHHAARLRRIGLLRVGDLLRVSPEDVLAEMPQEPVTLEMIESWQSQAKLVSRVRGLRPYDARILVACGIREPEQLVRLQPGALRARVKEFAATAQGHATLMSGTEYELSRVSDWIGSIRELLHIAARRDVVSTAADKGTVESDDRADRDSRRTRRSESSPADSPSFAVRRWADADALPADRNDDRRKDTERPAERRERGPRYYLQRSSAVVDAPAIGTAVAKRLERIGIMTVADLLAANPDETAARLEMRRISGDIIRQWQQQSELVCRVPRLRGHDAQFLVAAGTTSVEQLAGSEPGELWERVRVFAESIEGKRLVRGGDGPDLAEVSQWINWARHARALLAA